MYTSYKGRSLQLDKKVRVYRNLNNKKLSVMQNGLVIGHTDVITLSDATFIVNEAGRQRVIKENRKNVHAFVEGWFVPSYLFKGEKTVTYNPYNFPTFIVAWEKTPVYKAEYCTIYAGGQIIVKGVN